MTPPILTRHEYQARALIGDLLQTEQFPAAIEAFVAVYIADCQQKMRLAVKNGDTSRANYECGVLETYEGLIHHFKSFATASKRTI